MADLTAIYRDDVTEPEAVAAYQELINTGEWLRMDGTIGRNAMILLEEGYCILGEVGYTDYYGNYVPSRTEVHPGTKGSIEYAHDLTGFRLRCTECDGKGNAPDGNGIGRCAYCKSSAA